MSMPESKEAIFNAFIAVCDALKACYEEEAKLAAEIAVIEGKIKSSKIEVVKLERFVSYTCERDGIKPPDWLKTPKLEKPK